ncbi:TPA: hypothetical protein ACRVQG_003299 [Klebsiella variicola]
MTDITELAQSHELLIANGQQTADLLRHLADNEIDSDYFAVVSECESYGKETDAELSITEFALRAAGYVDALVEALDKAQQQMTESENRVRKQNRHICELFDDNTALRQRIAELESRTVTVKMPKPHAHLIWIQAGHAPDDYWDDVAVSHSEKDRCCDGSERYPVYARWEIEGMLTAAGIKWEAE